jgi:hypothetical protein
LDVNETGSIQSAKEEAADADATQVSAVRQLREEQAAVRKAREKQVALAGAEAARKEREKRAEKARKVQEARVAARARVIAAAREQRKLAEQMAEVQITQAQQPSGPNH